MCTLARLFERAGRVGGETSLARMAFVAFDPSPSADNQHNSLVGLSVKLTDSDRML